MSRFIIEIEKNNLMSTRVHVSLKYYQLKCHFFIPLTYNPCILPIENDKNGITVTSNMSGKAVPDEYSFRQFTSLKLIYFFIKLSMHTPAL
jgi:hypothetical protein